MNRVSIHDLKQGLASVIKEVQAGTDILITRHSKPVARLSRPELEHIHRGSRFGKADLKPLHRVKTAGRYLEFLEQDRRGEQE
jgi:antitoxin (DNA-binding transcriptional repressor) of toxin-antitoxin stability system